MAASPIDPRSWRETLSFISAFGLDHRPDVQGLLATIDPERITPGTAHRWTQLQHVVASYRSFHEQYPFLVAPPGTLNTGAFRTPLRQLADDQPLALTERELTEHVGIFGRSGGGKTTCVHHFAHEAYRHGLDVVTIDGKDDERSFPMVYPDTIIIEKNTPLPLLEPPSWLSLAEARPQLIRPLKHTMWGGEGLQQAATESHAHTLERHDRPSVADWRDEVRRLAHKGDTYLRRDRCEGLALRLDRLIEQYPGIGKTRIFDGIPLELLCTRSVYFGFGLHTEVEDFLTQWLLELRFSYNRAHDRRALNTFVLLDESNLLVHDRTIAEQAPLVTTFPLLREFGISVALTAANYQAVPLPIRSSLYLQIAMNLTDAKEANDIARTFGFTEPQRAYLDTKLTRGICIAKLGDQWKHPILARVEPITITKTVDPTAWRAALQRTNALARSAPPVLVTAAAREGVTGQQPALPAPPRLLPAAGHPELSLNTRIALNTNEEKLLRFIGEHRVVLTTECDLHPQLLIRAKKKLLMLGLITQAKITARAGRGGQASALGLTPSGCAWLNLSPGGAGGGGLQHQYLVRKLLETIPGAQREVSLDGKRVDVLVTYTSEHAWMTSVTGIAFRDSDHVGIEVELSDPTKRSNIEKNRIAGVTHTIVAVLPQQLARARAAVRDATVLNIFDLLRGPS